MAQQIAFTQKRPDPRVLLAGKLQEAPLEHAEALLKAYDVLQVAHEHGLLDVLEGAISAEDKIIDKVAGYANTPEGIHILRNLLVAGRIVGSVDPDLLHESSKELTASIERESAKPRPPHGPPCGGFPARTLCAAFRSPLQH